MPDSSRLPVVALVGRPNVGKSTLFNRLTRSRDALVADEPGLTRDRQYGFADAEPGHYIVVDTGGLTTEAEGLEAEAGLQSRQAIDEADCLLFLVDGKAGPTADDGQIADELRRTGKPVILVINKTERSDPDVAASEFHAFGFPDWCPISAAHGRGIRELVDALRGLVEFSELGSAPADGRKRVVIVGCPNAGKSTLVNKLIGEDRVLASEIPGTTRDSIDVPFEYEGRPYVLVDTAGIRRRARVHDDLEKFSVIKAMQSIERADVVIVLADAERGLAAQDERVLRLVTDRGRACVIGVNKWDRIGRKESRDLRGDVAHELRYVDYLRICTLSAKEGFGIRRLFAAVEEASAAAARDLPTPQLTRVLQKAVEQNEPPAVRGRRIKLRYAHQGGTHPPTVVIHGNQVESLPANYRRYLVKQFREAFELFGTPIDLQFRSGENPYRHKRNKLTPRQERRRKRVRKR